MTETGSDALQQASSMTTRPLETLSREMVETIAAAAERWQAEQSARLDTVNLGEHIDGRPIIGPEQAREAFEAIRTSPTRATLRRLIAELEPAAQLELIALAWLGRGEQDDDDTVTALERADRTATAGDAADYLAGRAPLGRYLRAGLEAWCHEARV